ncbi:MAG: ATPase, T2SS/T4P/T4SS family [Polyangiales bacterium]
MTGGFVVSVLMPDGTEQNISVADVDALTIGRDPECNIVLPSPAVSRMHLLVERGPTGICVTDQSSNGTTMGEEPVGMSAVPLSPHASLRVGPYLLRVAPINTAEASAGASAALRRRIHRSLLDFLDLSSLDDADMDDGSLRPRVVRALEHIVSSFAAELPPGTDTARLVAEMTDEALGLGPLQDLLEDASVSEIMVVDPGTIYVERHGKIQLTPYRFTDDESCRAAIERIVTPLGRRIDESTPLVDARLRDGSRVNAIIPPLAIRGPCITIRKFAQRPLRMAQLVALGSLSEQMARFLQRCVRAKKNLVISGGTGSGKTTLLNVLSTEIPSDERIVTIEDAAELRLDQPHVVSLESKPRNLEGLGGYSIRDLVKNALRMRPDRIIVGECRAGEAIDMLQAMNTGHEGSMTTTHANSAEEALKRIETLCMMAGLDLSPRSIRDQIAGSVHVVVQQTRFSDGMRRLTSITEVGQSSDGGELVLHDIFAFHRTGTSPAGEVLGEHRTTGYVPSFLDEFIAQGLIDGEAYL